MAPRATPARSRPTPDPRIDVLFSGYSEPGVAGTVGLVRDGGRRIIIDPGMVPRRSAILAPLARIGLKPEQVTDVIFSHHHPDHTLNAALFPRARFHDFWAIYHNDVWESRAAEGFRVAPHVQLLETPGHTPQDVTTLVETPLGVYAFTHLWWDSTGPTEDPLAVDAVALHQHRVRVAGLASWIVPGHGAPFRLDPKTPR
jgi:glyoxylase-like metal-dependent hydrolase (beta-lactamase superfamily II)